MLNYYYLNHHILNYFESIKIFMVLKENNQNYIFQVKLFKSF